MNVVREINAINQKELELGLNASWHDEYKDSARIHVSGLNFELTEGDVITIFSQYGEIMDINMPRDKDTGKPRGFAFLMYEDQRSTVLAVDNLNGAKVLERTLKVDHVKNYRQPKKKNEEGEWEEMEQEVLNARPELIEDNGGHESDSSDSSAASIDPEDPMRDYLLAQRREAKAKKKEKKKAKGKHKDETPEERAARKARKKEKKLLKAKKGKSEGVQAVQDLLSSLGVDRRDVRMRSQSRSPVGDRKRARSRSRSRSPTHVRRRRSPSPSERLGSRRSLSRGAGDRAHRSRYRDEDESRARR
ncbi:hypothetical protein BKA70DRAFT_1396132 [Coprinopsis sp. MPI-PUGE-AT-0042]|nr:hypothetical protein BKA70DRAFT_1396132 [Coprinopsis sp. MPI-PUGE-AT-0042]